jgi:hypothetical protein
MAQSSLEAGYCERVIPGRIAARNESHSVAGCPVDISASTLIQLDRLEHVIEVRLQFLHSLVGTDHPDVVAVLLACDDAT